MKRAFGTHEKVALEGLTDYVAAQGNSHDTVRSGLSGFVIAFCLSDAWLTISGGRSAFTMAVEATTAAGLKLPLVGWPAATLLPWTWLIVQAILVFVALYGMNESTWAVATGRQFRITLASMTPTRLRNDQQQALGNTELGGVVSPYFYWGAVTVAIIAGWIAGRDLAGRVPIQLESPYLTHLCYLALGLPLGFVAASTAMCLRYERRFAVGIASGTFSLLVLYMLFPPAAANGSSDQLAPALSSEAARRFRVLEWLTITGSLLYLASLPLSRLSRPRLLLITARGDKKRLHRLPAVARQTLAAPVLLQFDQTQFDRCLIVIYSGNKAVFVPTTTYIPVSEVECDLLRFDTVTEDISRSPKPINSSHNLYACEYTVSVTVAIDVLKSSPMSLPAESVRVFLEQMFLNDPGQVVLKAVQRHVDNMAKEVLDRFMQSIKKPTQDFNHTKATSRLVADDLLPSVMNVIDEVNARCNAAELELARTMSATTDGQAFALVPSHGTDVLSRMLVGETERCDRLAKTVAELEDRLEPIRDAWRHIRNQQDIAIGGQAEQQIIESLCHCLANTSPSCSDVGDIPTDKVRAFGQLVKLFGLSIRITKLRLCDGSAQQAQVAIDERIAKFHQDVRERRDKLEKACADVNRMAVEGAVRDQDRQSQRIADLIKVVGGVLPGLSSEAIRKLFEAATTGRIEGHSQQELPPSRIQAARAPVDPD